MENKSYTLYSKGDIDMAVNDWVEINYASEEKFVGQTAQIVAIKGSNVRLTTDEGECFWTDAENVSIC